MKITKGFAVLLAVMVLLAAVFPVVYAEQSDGDGSIFASNEEETLPGEETAPSETESVPEESEVPETTEPQETEPPATQPENHNQGSYVEEKKADYTKLKETLASVDALEKKDYTKESWSAVLDGVASCEWVLRNNREQSLADYAEQKLAKAIEALVPMDYSRLWTAILAVEELNKEDDVYKLWAELVLAVESGKELLSSGDQAAVDDATAEIYDCMKDARDYLNKVGTPEVITEEVEVLVEVLPEYDYCNVGLHRLWPVLFGVSAVMNVALVAAIVGILRKKQKQADDTPLIDYDIDDDAFDA